MGKSNSRNNPSNRKEAPKYKMVLSDDCINCQYKCPKGIKYLEQFAIKKEGNGVVCKFPAK